MPRPDRNIGTLQWLVVLGGLLGLDHFYLRSPGTGALKFLTLGGLGLWWIWDIVQTWFDSERILKYGMVAPFDAWIGIGQGMLYKKDPTTSAEWQYEQKTNFGLWLFGIIFGFTGIDMFVLDKFWLGFRKLIIFIVVALLLSTLSINSILNAGFFGWIWNFIVMFFAIGVGLLWFTDVYTMFVKPTTIMTDGIKLTHLTRDVLGWIGILFQDAQGNIIGSVAGANPPTKNLAAPPRDQAIFDSWMKLKDTYIFKDILGQEFLERFWIAREKEQIVGSGPAPPNPNSAVFPPFTLAYGAFLIIGGYIEKNIQAIMKSLVSLHPANIMKDTVIGLVEDAGDKILAKVGPAVDKLLPVYNKIKHVIYDGKTNPLNKVLSSVAPATATANDLVQTFTNPMRVPAPAPQQTGGGSSEPLSTESQILGATVLALIVGGSLKGLVDYLLTNVVDLSE